jgi:hypothetical protein
VILCQKRLKLSWIVDECKALLWGCADLDCPRAIHDGDQCSGCLSLVCHGRAVQVGGGRGESLVPPYTVEESLYRLTRRLTPPVLTPRWPRVDRACFQRLWC